MTVKAVGFESFLIDTWRNWGLIDTTMFQFYDCKLNKNVNDLRLNLGLNLEEFFDVLIDLDKLKIYIYHAQDKVETLNLHLSVTTND